MLLATGLAAIAGAANAGGFFALGQYTSHMTGYISQLADNLVVGNIWRSLIAVLALGAFIVGAAFSSFLINWERRRRAQRQYALPLALQGVFLLCFATGSLLTSDMGRLFSLCCLCFIMGMQNATITKISNARIRTTHATGMITDMGIELGRAVFRISQPESLVAADMVKLRILGSLVLAFFIGGVVGAIGFGQIGFMFSLPLGSALLILSLPGLVGGRRRRRSYFIGY